MTFISSSVSTSVAVNADNLFDIYLYLEVLVPILLVTSHPVNICETSNDEAVASSITQFKRCIGIYRAFLPVP